MGTASQKPRRLTAAEKAAKRRDRHGWRTAAKRNKFGTPTKAAEKRDAKRHENAVIAETRRKVWARSSGTCESCGDLERDTAQKWHKAEHEMHEVVPRSLTRGLKPEYRFSTENCARVCVGCHSYLQRHVVEFVFDSVLRMDGPYRVKFTTRYCDTSRVRALSCPPQTVGREE